MSTNVIFLGWDRAAPGREAQSGPIFQEFLQYLGGLQQAGTIQSFEPVFLSPHGGDMNGFVLIRGETSKLDAIQSSKEWMIFTTRAGQLMEGLGAVRGATGDLVMEWMDLWNKVLAT